MFTAHKPAHNGPDDYCRDVIIRANGGATNVCILTNGVGHCCGATTLGCMNQYFLNEKKNVKALLTWLKDMDGKFDNHYWKIRRLYFFLSDSTAYWDEHLRNYSGVEKIHSFNNEVSGSTNVDLYYLEF